MTAKPFCMTTELKMSFDALPLNAQNLLRKVGARKGVEVKVFLCEGPAKLYSSFRTKAEAHTGELTVTDEGWTGSDGEFNSAHAHAVKVGMVAMKDATYSRHAKWRFELAISDAAGFVTDHHRAAGIDAATLAVLGDYIEELGG